MNFTFTISTPSDGKKWGHITTDGTKSSGIVQDIFVGFSINKSNHTHIFYDINLKFRMKLPILDFRIILLHTTDIYGMDFWRHLQWSMLD